MKIPILTIRFANAVAQNEIPLFRGAIAGKVPPELTLFHNHTSDGLRYRYPLIQYKRINGKAAIVCIGEGTEAIGNFFEGADFVLRIGQREQQFAIESMQANQWLLQTWNTPFTYTIRKWLPLNAHNYAAYSALCGIAERASFLEKVLTGNILSMCTGLGVHLDKQVECKITDIISEQTMPYKGIRLTAMDLRFQTNVYIPDYISIGKAASHGFGMLHQEKITKIQNQ